MLYFLCKLIKSKLQNRSLFDVHGHFYITNNTLSYICFLSNSQVEGLKWMRHFLLKAQLERLVLSLAWLVLSFDFQRWNIISRVMQREKCMIVIFFFAVSNFMQPYSSADSQVILQCNSNILNLYEFIVSSYCQPCQN